jgi:hypothetical protein
MGQESNFNESLNEFLERIKRKVVQALPGVIESSLKPEIVAFSPTKEEEREMLSRDINGVGTWEGGRFLRQGEGGEGMPLRDAIAMESPVIQGDTVSFLNRDNLRNRTIFSWRRRNGEMLSIDPAEWVYVNALEYGGYQYSVFPRSDRKALNPEDGVYRKFVVKNIEPRRMMWQGLNSERFKNSLYATINRAVNEKLG